MDKPKIVGVEHIDNSAVVQFEGESDPAIFPADLLFAAKELADVFMERELEDHLGTGCIE